MKTRRLHFAMIVVLFLGFFLTGCEEKITPKAESIRIETYPSKTVYSVGDSLDLAGLSVVCHYSDGTESGLAVGVSDVTGFDSSAIVQDQVLTVAKEGVSAHLTVHIIGDLVGEWKSGTTVKFTLNADMTSSTDWMRGGTWSIDGTRLFMTYTEQLNETTNVWDDLHATRYIHWDWAVIGGKLYINSPFVRKDSGTTLAGTFEQIVWYTSFPKLRVTITGAGGITMSQIPQSSATFDTQTETGEWDEAGLFQVLTAQISSTLPLVGTSVITNFTVSSSTLEGTLPNGANYIVWFTPDRFGVDTPGWTRD